MNKKYFVYIATNKRNTVLYTGVTNNLSKRMFEHKNKLDPKSYTARYNVEKLVYFEVYSQIYDAIAREKQIKAGSRKRKISLINAHNSTWKDLSNDDALVL